MSSTSLETPKIPDQLRRSIRQKEILNNQPYFQMKCQAMTRSMRANQAAAVEFVSN